MGSDLVRERVLAHLREALDSKKAREELDALGKGPIRWHERVHETIDAIVPRLVEIGPDLLATCVAPFNAAYELSLEVARGFPAAVSRLLEASSEDDSRRSQEWLDAIAAKARAAALWSANVESQQVSAELRRAILDDTVLGRLLKPNRGSTYPDLIAKGRDYSFLPLQTRTNPVDGPCMRGKADPVPSNVPDGCEIKANQAETVHVDAHGVHPGLHLAVTWGFEGRTLKGYDLWIAYIRGCDHTISNGSVDVTTKKRSFGHAPFLSLLRGAK
jgi:hypothetical protein